MALKLSVGSSALIGALERYAQRLDLLEVAAESGALPVPRTLRRWRELVPPTFHFSLVLPREVAALSGGEAAEAALGQALDAARTLAASWLLVRTPMSVAPSERGRRRLADLVAKLRPMAARIAWEPRGVWSPEDAEAFARELDIVAVRDLAQSDAPDGPVVYTRLLSIGQQSILGQAAIERVAERLADADEAFVIVEGRGAPGVARRLRAELSLSRVDGDELPEVGATGDEPGESEDSAGDSAEDDQDFEGGDEFEDGDDADE